MLESDNTYGAHPRVVEALEACNAGQETSYGADGYHGALQGRLREVFEHPELEILTFVTGTAANSVGLASLTDPWGAVLCHEHAHILVDECNGPELLGGKLLGLAGAHGKLTAEGAEGVENFLSLRPWRGHIHNPQPQVLSLTNLNEWGQSYSCAEVAALSEVARGHDLAVHMDGARLVNALAHEGCRPAALTWQAGVDVLTLGASKGGCLMAEVLVLFDPTRLERAQFHQKRTGHLVSKGRYVAAQVLAWLEDDLWLQLAQQANATAQSLVQALEGWGTPMGEVQGNMVFLQMAQAQQALLRAAGLEFYAWPLGGPNCVRMVCAHNVSLEALLVCLERAR